MGIRCLVFGFAEKTPLVSSYPFAGSPLCPRHRQPLEACVLNPEFCFLHPASHILTRFPVAMFNTPVADYQVPGTQYPPL